MIIIINIGKKSGILLYFITRGVLHACVIGIICAPAEVRG